MKELNIYLGGKMAGLSFDAMNEWRRKIKSLLLTCADEKGVKLDVVNPCDYFSFEEKRHQNEAEIMQFDLNKVRNSDIVIVNIADLNTSIGTAIELYEAKRLNIPVIAYNPFGEVDYSKIHPWLQCCITRVEDYMNDVKDYIRDFYMV